MLEEEDLLVDGEGDFEFSPESGGAADHSEEADLVTDMGSKVVETRYKIDKWIGIGNFSLWSSQMKDKLIAQGQGKALETTAPSGMSDEAWEELCIRVCSEIRLHLSNDIQMQVLDYTSSHELWSYLVKRYQNKSTTSRMHAKTKLWSCKMKEGEDLAAYVQKFTSLTCEIVALGDDAMNDEDKSFLLLHSLPKSLDHLVQTLMYGKDKLVFEDVYSALLSENIRKPSGTNSSSSAVALNVERGRSKSRGRDVKFRGRSKSRSKSRGRPGKKEGGERLCWKCGQAGHLKNNCTQDAPASTDSKGKGKASSSEANVVVSEDEDYVL